MTGDGECRTQRVMVPGGAVTWTVLDSGYGVVGPAEEFLEYLRVQGTSSNTVKSYSRALALWWTYLSVFGLAWDELALADVGGFLAWLRSGDGPQVVSIGPRPARFAESTISTRLRAVTSCYRFHELNGVALGGDLVRVVHGGRAAYKPMLEHVARRKGRQRAVIRVREPRHQPPPVLTPGQVGAICDACARFDPASGQWTGQVRDRLLWSLLAETGMFFGDPNQDGLDVVTIPAGQRLIKIGQSHHRCCTKRPVLGQQASEQQRQRAPHPRRRVAKALREGSGATSRDRLRTPGEGLRLGEALGLQHQDWRTGRGDTPFIEVVPRDHPHGVRVKAGRYRRVFISDELDRLYGEYLWQLCEAGADLAVPDLDAAPVFMNLAGGTRFAPWRPESVYDLVGRLRRDLARRVPAAWTPHWMRHSHATALLMAGVPVHVVSRRLGHADVQTTLELYAHVTEDADMRSVAEWRAFTAGWRAVSVAGAQAGRCA